MTGILDMVLGWAAKRAPDTQGDWIEDLQHEAQHIPAGFRRQHFLWSGVQAAFGEILRVSIGPRRLGQWLLGLAGGIMCCLGFIASVRLEDPVVKTAFFLLLTLYGIAAGLAVLNLNLLKRFAAGSSLCLIALWALLGLRVLPTGDLPVLYMRALSIEASVVMMGLCIAAYYLACLLYTSPSPRD